MKEKIKEVLTKAHCDIRDDVKYYTIMKDGAINGIGDDIARRLYEHKAAARSVDALIRELLMSDLENTFDDTFRVTLQRYHRRVNKDLAYYNAKWYEVPKDAPQDEKDRAYDRYCRYALIAERVDKLISDLLLAELD